MFSKKNNNNNTINMLNWIVPNKIKENVKLMSIFKYTAMRIITSLHW